MTHLTTRKRSRGDPGLEMIVRARRRSLGVRAGGPARGASTGIAVLTNDQAIHEVPPMEQGHRNGRILSCLNQPQSE